MGGSTPPLKGVAASAAPGTRPECPSKLVTIVSGPAEGLVAGTWLRVVVEREGIYRRAVLIDEVSDQRVGSLAGVPDLETLLRCLDDGVRYRGFVDHVSGGRVDVTIIRE